MHNFFAGVDDELMELESDKKHLLYDERRANKFFGNAVEKSFKVGTGHDFMECVPPSTVSAAHEIPNALLRWNGCGLHF